MRNWFLFVGLLLPALALADTTWVNQPFVGGEWTADHSPYMIQRSVEIPDTAFLHIGPGVEVNFTGNYSLSVFGSLQAIGTADDSILFTRRPADSLHRWAGINLYGSDVTELDYCVIEHMRDQTNGGIYVVSGSLQLSHSTVHDNYYVSIYLQFPGSVEVSHCTFVHNGFPGTGGPGPVIRIANQCTAEFSDCFIAYNGAIDGGAIDMESHGQLTLARCVFKNNHAHIMGGAIFADNSIVSATQCIFLGNRALVGGHIGLFGAGSQMSLNSCIFAFSRGPGGAFDYSGQTPEIRNCAFFGNAPIFLSGQGPAGFGVTDHVNGNGTPCDIYANIFINPMFADTSSDSLRLQVGSPCINAGDSSLGWDEDGSPPDMGAHSRPASTEVCGDVSGVWDLAGSPYIVTCDLLIPANQTLEIRPGVRIEFNGPYAFFVNGTLRAIGTESDSVVFTTDTTANPDRWQGLRLIEADDASLFSYCVIENAYWPSAVEEDAGGGLHALNCSPTVSHCLFQHNRSARNGAGLSGYHSNMVVTDCRFVENHAPYGGGVIFNFSPSSLYRCVFERNSAGQGGGVGYWWNAGSVINCTFIENHGDDAGGVRTANATVTVVNSLFVGNTGRAPIAFYQEIDVPVIAYNCFWDNPEPPVFSNNEPPPPGIGTNVQLNANGDSCDIYFNFASDPRLVNLATGDYSLQANSPCIDAGDPLRPPDLDSTIADIGAFPFLHVHSWTTAHFPGGFAGIGCPCAYPFQLPEGSLVRLRRDLSHNGPSSDDVIAGAFSISAGSGLPPWDGYWTPRPDSQLVVDSYYIELLTGTCCWLSGMLNFAGGDTALVDVASWSCQESATEDGCLSTDPSALDRTAKQLGSLTTLEPVALVSAPNPFNVTTEFRFTLNVAARVELVIFDIMGRRVVELAHGEFDSGSHRLAFDGTNLATGIYFVRFQAGSQLMTQKLLLLK